LSDAITIEKRTVPRESHRSRALRPQRRAQPQPRTVAQLPQLRRFPVPTLPPIATAPPTIEPTPPPAMHLVRVPDIKPAPKTPFSAQQMAALDQRFRRTIAAADRSLSDVPRQRRPPAIAPYAQRYAAVMAGSPQQFLAAQGDCTSLQDAPHGAIVDRVLRCLIRYSDGYYEEVTFPWQYHFYRRTDPFGYLDGQIHPFPMQAPPPGFVLPQPFALSRAVCSFYRAQCQALIDRETAAGNQPAPATP
ncbi:MAG TPA: hypothetical protein VFE70_08640, partial [Candidatus Elarobacter sp.]|nr:hypothetical protein [Candidatus Elarobacter sp.]